jgi:23S rRNA (cytidine1920-2'-O)/16S rRNA (cytidine1409-2'-O)-methyltransferase
MIGTRNYVMVKVKKNRIDALLVERDLCEGIDDAKKLIMAGKVRIGKDHLIQKASDKYPIDSDINVKQSNQYVSRGAYKLLPALDKYLPDLTGLISIDIGASTGGFTDLMLQRGVIKAYTVDSGRGQLHAKLRNDPRVECFEKTNARLLKDDFLDVKADVLVMDVSFISVTLLLIPTIAHLKKGSLAFILIKPQFEAKRSDVGQGGVVRDRDIHKKVIDKVVTFATNKVNLEKLDIIDSPITGPKGNQEYIAVLKKI